MPYTHIHGYQVHMPDILTTNQQADRSRMLTPLHAAFWHLPLYIRSDGPFGRQLFEESDAKKVLDPNGHHEALNFGPWYRG
jgi:hypothetical protein